MHRLLHHPASPFLSCRHQVVAETLRATYIRRMDTKPATAKTPPRCEDCGRYDAHLFDGTWLCGDCLQSRGSCCAERPDQESDDCRNAPAKQSGITD